MISKAVELAQTYGRLGENELLELTDATLLQRLFSIPSPEAPDPAIAGLARAQERRLLLKRGYVLSALTVPPGDRAALVDRFHANRAARTEAEEVLARSLGCQRSDVILYCPALTVMKEAAALVRTPRGLQRLNEIDTSPLSEIQALEGRYAHLWRFYVFVPEAYAARAAGAAREITGFPSELRRAAES